MEETSNRKVRTLAFVFIVVAGIYGLFPTQNYYWDGVSFAQTIEDAGRANWPTLIHPNHLAYNAIGFVFYTAARQFGVRALSVLQYINIIVSALAAMVLCAIVRRLTRSDFLGVVASFFFAFSAIWWKFSTDADSYIPSVFLLLVITYLILCAERVRPVLIALVHVAAMVLHQLALFMLPAIIAGILLRTRSRARLRAVTLYSTIASGLTFAAYYAGFVAQTGKHAISDFGYWVVSHSPEVGFTFTMRQNIVTSLEGQVKLFLGGRLSSALEYRSAGGVILAILWTLSLIVLLCTLIAHRRAVSDFFRSFSRPLGCPEIIFAGVWTLSYIAFLLFWLPHNTFYRLFYLPPLIITLAIVWRNQFNPGDVAERIPAALILCIGLFNLTFYIYPATQLRTNPPLMLAFAANGAWPPGTEVIFGRSTADNWVFRYFNPQTIWIALSDMDSAKMKTVLSAARENRNAVWFDVTATEQIPALVTCTNQRRLELLNEKYHIRFGQAFPCATASQ